MEPRRIYLDHNATTPLDPQVITVLTEAMETFFANPSSAHSDGRAVRQQINRARRFIASYLKVRPQELIFTSGGTEGLNTVLRGVTGHIISSSAEHSAVYATLLELQARGQSVTFLSPGLQGAVTPAAVRDALRPDTALIALMAANNETGVKTDIEEVAAIAHEAHVPFLVDAVAWLGKEPIVIPAGVSAMCFSGHKLHAPKGIGCLFLRSGFKIPSLLTGGGQEFGKRGGTENVLGILALAEAIRLLEVEGHAAFLKMAKLRDRLEAGILSHVAGAQVNGKGPRVGNTTNISFPQVDGETLLIALDRAGLAVSHGSACATGALEPSRILLEMGITRQAARSAMRFSLSRFTSEEEVDRAIEIIASVLGPS